jgi:hypothetical protein
MPGHAEGQRQPCKDRDQHGCNSATTSSSFTCRRQWKGYHALREFLLASPDVPKEYPLLRERVYPSWVYRLRDSLSTRQAGESRANRWATGRWQAATR